MPRANDLGEAKLKFLLAEFVGDGEIFDVTGMGTGWQSAALSWNVAGDRC